MKTSPARDACPLWGTAGSGVVTFALVTAISLVRLRGEALAKTDRISTKHDPTNTAVRSQWQARGGR